MSRSRAVIVAVVFLAVAASCHRADPPKRYPLKGQILSIQADRQELMIKHEDIPGFMPGMTMSYPVARPELLQGRAAGELITATLEVTESQGRLTEITHIGSAPVTESTNSVALAAGLLAEGDEVPDTAFIDQNDKRRSFSEWKGSLTLITFIYTSCPDPTFCPLMDQNFSTIQRTVAEDPSLKGQVQLVSVSFDPAHDTPAVLKAHAAAHKADPAMWTYLTGDAATLDRFVAHFGVGLVASDKPGAITHNVRTALIGRDGRIMKFYTGNDWTPGAVLADMRAATKTR